MYFKPFWLLLRNALSAFYADKAPVIGAALAYFGVFSLAPFFYLSLAFIGLLFGRNVLPGRLFLALQGTFGEAGANVLQWMVFSAGRRGGAWLPNLIATLFVLMGAFGVYFQLKDALDTIWPGAKKEKNSLRKEAFSMLSALLLVLASGFFMVSFLLLSALLGAFTKFFEVLGGLSLWNVLNFGLSLSISVLLFGMIYRYIPERKIAWRFIWPGAFFTAILFTLGKSLFGWFLGRTDLVSLYGGASSFVALLMWLDSSAQVLLFGAEFIKAYEKGGPVGPPFG